jgi:hypothetical protein
MRNEWIVYSDTKKSLLLTGPTQLRTSVVCLAISSSEAGLVMSQIIIPTSDDSVGLPKIKNKSFKENPIIILHLPVLFIAIGAENLLNILIY